MGKFAKRNQKEQRLSAKKQLRKPRSGVPPVSLVEENDDPTDPQSSDFMYDDADRFHQKKQKSLLDKGFHAEDDNTDAEEEIMPLEGVGSSDEEEDTDEDDDEMDDDDDADLDGDEKGIPSSSAWGSKRASYYNTDFVDKDHGKFHGADAEEAEEEELEAKRLQRELANELAESDFGSIITENNARVPSGVDAVYNKPDEPDMVVSDISKLTEFDILERIKHESPELLDLISDCKEKLKELCEVIQPLIIALSGSKRFLSDRAELYVRTKYQLILGYCQNVFFYMSLKAKRVSVENHPVTRRLVDFRRFLLKLKPLDQMYKDPITKTLEIIKRGGDPEQLCRQSAAGKPKKRVTFSATVRLSDSKTTPIDVPMSKKIKEKPSTKLPKPSNSGSEDEDDDGLATEHTTEGKRKLTYQIEKNKGARPYRKKEFRNPRVKHRIKYRKAQISRKGQVRIYKPEMKKYAGEPTGIRAGVVKSIKFK